MNANKNETAYARMLLLFTAMPGVKLEDRRDLVEKVMAEIGFDDITFRLNIDLCDDNLMRGGIALQPGINTGVLGSVRRLRDWWINEYRMGDHVGHTLDLVVHFEDGTCTARVIGVDSEMKRILTVDGKVYQLNRRLVSPEDIAVEEVPREYITAETFLTSYKAEERARRYVDAREQEAMQFFRSLKWEPSSAHAFCVQADVYGVRIVHEMQERRLHATPCWGELFFPNQEGREPIMMHTFEQFLAYMLAKYW